MTSRTASGAGMAGRAFLVGAGPGDPDLLTLKAARLIGEADVLLFDSLVGREILALAKPGARLVDVGKRCGRPSAQQAAINRLIATHARAGRMVVRLKGGDPFVFGRGGEELASLRAAGVAVEVVPGITTALAVGAALQVPLTHRGMARGLHLLTAHTREGELPAHDWTALARGGTLAIYMGVRTLPLLAARLLTAGMAPETPAIAVQSVTLPEERRIPGTLADIADRVAAAGGEGPTLVLIGEIAAMALPAAGTSWVAAA
ncbi:uroporphyrinogen-III C-methyltransferase [Siccirubricoccus phaeus]|uniref:uroporphyrinogen-III C-methyltransferase n=1 Tax=Siccirubricoccus phaeus TaxID=2595053 RepID=UPI001A9C69D3|nr:uroporphyrinogen-III C-methyltransferase [Siccirubricoccus phaeus]